MPESILRKYADTFVSKWLILAIDLGIATFSYFMACLLRFNFEAENINWQFYKLPFFFLLGVRLLCFLFYRSYTGIVRHTSVEDALTLFKAVLLSSLLIAGTTYWLQNSLHHTQLFIPFSILVIDFFICLYLMVGSRFLVKFIYENLFQRFKSSSTIMIYGAGNSGITTKKVLLNDKNRQYEILGFIDDNPSKINKSIEGLRVYSLEEALAKYLVQDKSVEVILTMQDITPSRRSEIVEIFLQRGVLVKTVPPSQRWVEGEFNVNEIHGINIEDLLERPSIQLNTQKIQKELTGKTIMVTGAAGSIGSEIVRQLLKFAPHRLVLVDQSESGLYDLEYEINSQYKDYLTQTQLNIVVANVTDDVRMRNVFRSNKPNLVFHAAAYKHVPMMENNPYEAVKVNVLGTKNIADFSVEFGVDKFVMVSTDKAVNPTNVMGATRRLAEMYTQSMNNLKTTRFVATRFGNVLGSNGSVIPLFKKQIEVGGPITITHPEITRFFMTIPESSQLVLEAGSMGEGGEVFVFDMGEPVRIVDLAKKMVQLSGLTLGKDIKLQYTGLRPGEKLYEELLNDNENTLPTHHSKIMRAKVNAPSYAEMEVAFSEIKHLLEGASNNDLIAYIKYLVPEYLSNNSVYEKLDKPQNLPHHRSL